MAALRIGGTAAPPGLGTTTSRAATRELLGPRLASLSVAPSFYAVRSGLEHLLVHLSVAYVLWVLGSVVAWVSHLGVRLPSLAPFLAGGGGPQRAREGGLLEVTYANAVPTLLFVLPHSAARPAALQRIFGRYGRLLYNMIAAASLHVFLTAFVPLNMSQVLELPIPAPVHDALSVGCLVLAFLALLSEQQTMAILGVTQALRQRKGTGVAPIPRMDIITWQGICVHRWFGEAGYLLFTGLSILPRHLTVMDIVVRVAAASYLRCYSPTFRQFVGSMRLVHALTWAVRAGLILFALSRQQELEYSMSGLSALLTDPVVIAGAAAAIVLHQMEH